MSRTLLVATAATLALSTAAFAQTEAPKPVPDAGTSETAPPATTGEQPSTGAMDVTTGLINKQEENHVLVSEYDGADVYDSNGEQIGEIADLILDDQNKLVGFVVATGGFLGVAEHNVGVALGELTESTDPEGFTIATSREQLEAAPEFLTLEAVEAEREAARVQQQTQQPPLATPAPAPAPQPPAQ